MPQTFAAKRAAFAKLHEEGCFVIPNPWDVGSAIALQGLGFKALASTSAGLAWSLGRADNKITLDQVLAHLTAVAAAVDIPLNADFENGFAHDPAGVAANVSRAIATGIAGLSIVIPQAIRRSHFMTLTWPYSGLPLRGRPSTPAVRASCSPRDPKGSSRVGRILRRQRADYRPSPRRGPIACLRRACAIPGRSPTSSEPSRQSR